MHRKKYRIIRYRIEAITGHGIDYWYYDTRFKLLALLSLWIAKHTELFRGSTYFSIVADVLYNESILVFKDDLNNKSLRLNVFRGISLKGIGLSKWKVRKNIIWLKNCPLPKGEVFMRVMN